MRTFLCITVTALLMLPAIAPKVSISAGTYYPYQTYDEYHREHSATPPVGEKPPTPPPPPAEVKPPPRPVEPITITEPPDFLFPPELGFGVAVGVPYDLFYVRKEFYAIKNGNWYRSHSYNGPYMLAGASGVPAELRKQKLSRIRELRNREFQKFYKDREHYKGKHFRPGQEQRLPSSSKPIPTPAPPPNGHVR